MENEKVAPSTPEVSPGYAGLVGEIERLVVGIVHPPKLLDWFVGLASIAWGVSLILTSTFTEEFKIGRFESWIFPLMVSAIAGGSGVIIAEMSERVSSNWKKVFLLILVSVYATMALLFWRGADVDGVLIYGLMSFVILVLLIVEPGSRLLYMILVQALFGGLLVLIRYFPEDPHLAYLNNLLTGGVSWVIWIWFANLLIYVVFSWWGYFRKRRLLSVMLGLTALPLILLSLTYGSQNQWSKAFLILVMAVFGVLVPFWEQLKFRYRKHRTMVYRMFAVILAFFVGTAALIRVVQTILINNATLKVADQVTYGRILTESIVESSVSSVEGLAQNPGLSGGTVNVVQSIFQGNKNLRRIMVVNQRGVVTSVYPLKNGLVGDDVSRKEYFKAAVSGKKTYFPTVFMPEETIMGEKAIPFSAPIFDSRRQIVGVVVGFVDLELLADRLSEVETPNSRQYFGLIDKGSKWIINPDPSKVNKMLELNDPARKAVSERTGVEQGYDASGTLSLISYTRVGRTGWGLTLVQPVFTALNVSQIAYVVVLAVASLSVAIIGLTVLPRKPKEELEMLYEKQ